MRFKEPKQGREGERKYKTAKGTQTDKGRGELGIISLPVLAERQKRKSKSEGKLGRVGNLPKQLWRALITILNKI